MAVIRADLALRKWAIEQAMKWPQVSTGIGGGAYGGGLGGGAQYQDADVIGRAQRLIDYVLNRKKD